MSLSSEVDWTPFDSLSETTNWCRCGQVYRSHSKMVANELDLVLVTRKPCPSCGSDSTISRSTTDWETYEL